MKRSFIFAVCFILIGAGFAFATPIVKINQVNYSDTAKVKFTTYQSNSMVTVGSNYSLNTDIGTLDAFCVEGVLSGDGDFELIPVPAVSALQSAAWVAEQYWTHSSGWSYSKEATQILIWELALGNIFTYLSNGDFSNAQEVTNAIDSLKIGTPSSNVSLLSNPIGSTTYTNDGKQNFLVNHSVPEPATLLFLGLSIIGLGVAGRKQYRK